MCREQHAERRKFGQGWELSRFNKHFAPKKKERFEKKRKQEEKGNENLRFQTGAILHRTIAGSAACGAHLQFGRQKSFRIFG